MASHQNLWVLTERDKLRSVLCLWQYSMVEKARQSEETSVSLWKFDHYDKNMDKTAYRRVVASSTRDNPPLTNPRVSYTRKKLHQPSTRLAR